MSGRVCKEILGVNQSSYHVPNPEIWELIRLCTPLSQRAGEPAGLKEGLRLLSFDTLFSCQGALAPSQGTQHNSLSPGFGFAGKPGCSAHPIAPSAAMPPSQSATADQEL
jgi:hypothetical protein